MKGTAYSHNSIGRSAVENQETQKKVVRNERRGLVKNAMKEGSETERNENGSNENANATSIRQNNLHSANGVVPSAITINNTSFTNYLF